QIWDLLRYPSTRATGTPTAIGYFVSLGPGAMGITGEGQYTRESTSIQITVDRTSGRIQSIQNRRDRFNMTLNPDGTINDSDEVIGPNGYPQLVLQTKDFRVQPFETVNIGPTTGFNVRQSFQNFLAKNGMTNSL